MCWSTKTNESQTSRRSALWHNVRHNLFISFSAVRYLHVWLVIWFQKVSMMPRWPAFVSHLVQQVCAICSPYRCLNGLHISSSLLPALSDVFIKSGHVIEGDRGLVDNILLTEQLHSCSQWWSPSCPLSRPQTLCSAVVQVYVAERSCSWVKRCCGVACLVKDNPQRSYFIRVFDIKVSEMKHLDRRHNAFCYFLLFTSYIFSPALLMKYWNAQHTQIIHKSERILMKISN